MVWPTMSGMIVERRDHVLMTRFSFFSFKTSTFFNRWSSMKGPFFRLRGISVLYSGSASCAAAATTSNDQLVGGLLARTRTTLRLAPRRHRVTTTRGLAFATTEWVVHRVHRHTTRLRSDTLPPVS